MIRGRTTVAVAVRRPDGSIQTRTEPLNGPLQRYGAARLPLVRGVLTLWDTLALGTRAMIFAANVAAGEATGGEIPPLVLWGALLPALVFGVLIFFVGPLLIVTWLEAFVGAGTEANLLEGVIRVVLLIAYIWLIGRSKDIRRVFAYHGAEHKAVHAFEHGVPLLPAEIQRFSPEHPRCGTAFLLTVMVVSVFVFALLGQPPFEVRLLSRIVLIPIIAAFGYEILRWAAGHYESNALVRMLYWPNLALQALTTRQPSDDQVEVAIVSLQLAIDNDAETGQAQAA